MRVEKSFQAMPKLLHHLDLTTGYHTIHRIDTFSQSLVSKYGKL